MSTRMQQRRGTSTQWNTGNPVLASGEIGFETDTNQFKMGDGTSHWAALSYFKNLEDLGGTLDDYVLASTKGEALGVATLDADGLVPMAQIPTLVGLDSEITTAVSNAVSALVDGAPLALNTLNELAAAVNDDSSFSATMTLYVDNISELADNHYANTTVHGATGHVVGTTNTQTLTNKTMSGASNTFTAIPQSAVTDLVSSFSTIDTEITTIEENASAQATAIALRAPIASPTFSGTVGGITKSMVGLGSVDNTTDANKPVSSATQTALDLKADATAISELAQDAVNTALVAGIGLDKTYDDAANTITIDIDSTVSTKVYADLAVTTHSEDTTNIHGIVDTSALATKTYADSAVTTHSVDTTDVHGIADTSALALTATVNTALNLKAPLASPTFTGTVSGVTATHVGLGNVDNTSDANKPVSTATQTALGLKADATAISELAQDAVNTAIVAGTGLDKTYDDTANTITIDIDSTVATKTYADGAVSTAVAALTKSSVGLSNVDNTSDANKPVSTAVATSLDLKAPVASPTFTGTVSGITKTMVGLGSVDNTADTAKPVSTATQTALDLKANLASPTFTGTPTLPTGTIATTQTAANSTTAVATTAFVTTADNLKANIASPTFTGTVSGITKGMVGLGSVDNTADTAKPVSTAQATAIATAKSEAIADATAQVTAVIGGASSALDTLSELATALGNDANFASTVTTSLAGKTDELYAFTTDATTARVLVIGDKFKSLKFTSASATAVTIPTNASVAFPIGSYIEFYQFGAGQLTITAATPGTTSIRSTDSQNKSRTQYSSMVIVKVGTDEWLLTGDLTA